MTVLQLLILAAAATGAATVSSWLGDVFGGDGESS